MKKEQKKGNDNNKLYDFDFETKEEKKAKKKKADDKSASKKRKRGKSQTTNKKMGQELPKKKYEDEIIIGVTKYPEKKIETKNNKKKTKRNTKEKNVKRRKNQNDIEKYNVDRPKKKIVKNEQQDNIKKIENRKKRNKIIKIILLILLIGTAVILALLSPMFNIAKIEVIGNKQVTREELVSLSGIKIDDNIFKVRRIKTAENIKQNAYVNEVSIHRILPNKIQISITERESNYMLEYGNGYVYINKQGYMLEISSIKKELPIIIGTSTLKEEYRDGNRLNEEDLIKLSTVIKIMNAAQTNGIATLITKIDISDSNNYTLYFESERKVAYLGDCSNLETRMLFLEGILNKEKENPGEIFVNMNLNIDDAFFRESV